MLAGRHLLEPSDLSVEEMEELFTLADNMIVDPVSFQDVCKGKLLATLFFEPSTRTRLSFEAAMLHMGGSVMGFADSASTSSSKGETLADTIRVVSSYSDVIAIRNPKEGSALVASRFSTVPVINAGDGGHHHPTQTLTDLLTIRSSKGTLENHTIGLCGDLMFGRTVHSLAKAMSRYKGNKFVLISPPELTIPDYIIKEVFEANNIPYKVCQHLDEVIGDLDILYMTRVQKERFFNEQDYIRLKDSYILNTDKLKNARSDMIILHPLPRVNEIATEVDSDPRALYFRQVKYGMYARMALMAKLTGAL